MHVAGQAGYILAKKYNWETAARLIHMKSRPDVPPLSYANYPNWQAEAYMRKRAQEEAATEGKA